MRTQRISRSEGSLRLLKGCQSVHDGCWSASFFRQPLLYLAGSWPHQVRKCLGMCKAMDIPCVWWWRLLPNSYTGCLGFSCSVCCSAAGHLFSFNSIWPAAWIFCCYLLVLFIYGHCRPLQRFSWQMMRLKPLPSAPKMVVLKLCRQRLARVLPLYLWRKCSIPCFFSIFFLFQFFVCSIALRFWYVWRSGNSGPLSDWIVTY